MVAFFPVVNKIKNVFWGPVDVFLSQGPNEQVSKIFCFTALVSKLCHIFFSQGGYNQESFVATLQNMIPHMLTI